MQGEQIKEKLHNGERVYGIHVCQMGGSHMLNEYSKLNLDFVFIDTEHMPNDRTETSVMCRYFSSQWISPLVRVAYPNPHLVTQAVDGGAQGILVPYVETVDEVKEMVGAVHYRPLKGQRLRDVLNGEFKLNKNTHEYLSQLNRHQYLIIGIESVPAYQNLDDLLSINGIDVIFIGPHDLSISLEMPEEYDNPAFIDVVSDIIHRSRKAGLGVGMHLGPDNASIEQIETYMDAGMNWILYSHDVSIMQSSSSNDLSLLRQIKGDSFWRGDQHLSNDTTII